MGDTRRGRNRAGYAVRHLVLRWYALHCRRAQRSQKYSPTGNHRGSIGNGQGQADGEFLHPHGVGVNDDEIYVVDTHNSRVQVFDMNGNFRRKWGSSEAGDLELVEPYGVAFDMFGDVYISEHGGGRIKKFAP